MKYIAHIVLMILFLVSLSLSALAQDKWELKKQENDIKVYTKSLKNSPVLSYKIKTTIEAPLEIVFEQVVDFQENKQYLSTIKNIRIIEKNEQYITIHLIFDMPWPFEDRDLVNKMKIDRRKDSIFLHSTPANNRIPKLENTVRLQDFFEEWELKRTGKNQTELLLEGHADPNIMFPAWVLNLFVIQEPYALINGIKTEAEKNVNLSGKD